LAQKISTSAAKCLQLGDLLYSLQVTNTHFVYEAIHFDPVDDPGKMTTDPVIQ